ncbi:hypothetical protein AYO40_00650 [Planctomycetaceae bacterium SCGC AG-212-D15]|nr:hypothetical protein AYO40_00650 [Planctomycetaceae bacterium SCGC AG-212-D15]
MRVLIDFALGLGDSVQLTVVLQHLRRFRPEWDLYLRIGRGKHPVGRGYCHRVWHDQEPGPPEQDFDQVLRLGWFECYTAYADHPSTKACNCLREVFSIRPVPELCRYRLETAQEDREVTARYLRSIGCERRYSGRFNAMVLHYQGNTSPWRKNLTDEQAGQMCELAVNRGFVPVVLDWDRRSPLPDQRRIHCPLVGSEDIWGHFGSGDASRIAALVEQSSFFLGIDSGPGKCAAATSTPALIVWTEHHPIQFHDLDAGNVLHLVPEHHLSMPLACHEAARRYFVENYRFRTYRPDELSEALFREVDAMMRSSRFVGQPRLCVPEERP